MLSRTKGTSGWLFGIIYVNTSSPENFVDYLRFMDLQLDEDYFTSEAFARKVRSWDADENKIREEAEKLKRREMQV